jgi:Uma2 family endonuclease
MKIDQQIRIASNLTWCYTRAMTALGTKTMTEAEYLEFERTSETRHEFVDGTLVAMAGETLKHDNLVLNVIEALRPKARAKKCHLHATNVQTRVKDVRYRYPDIVISCEQISNERLLEHPCFILEVLSDSTADTDHGAKLEEYTALPSMQRYAIVSQHIRQVLLYKRLENLWTFEVIVDAGTLEIPCLETTLSLDEIYFDVIPNS